MENNLIFIFITFGACALMYFYGRVQRSEGYSAGYARGNFEGQVKGANAIMLLYEDLDLVKIEDLAKQIKSGKYDHIGNVGKIRSLIPDDDK